MGTITKRKRANGSVAHMARVRIKDGSVVVHSETETFDRDAAATHCPAFTMARHRVISGNHFVASVPLRVRSRERQVWVPRRRSAEL